MAWWKAAGGRTHRGLVKAEDADDAVVQLAYSLQEGCEIVNQIYFCDNEKDARITPQMLCVNFRNTAEYTLFG